MLTHTHTHACTHKHGHTHTHRVESPLALCDNLIWSVVAPAELLPYLSGNSCLCLWSYHVKMWPQSLNSWTGGACSSSVRGKLVLLQRPKCSRSVLKFHPRGLRLAFLNWYLDCLSLLLLCFYEDKKMVSASQIYTVSKFFIFSFICCAFVFIDNVVWWHFSLVFLSSVLDIRRKALFQFLCVSAACGENDW